MKLTNDMKELMAFLYSRENIVRYEFSFDKRDSDFYARIFLTETIYWTISFSKDSNKVKVLEYSTVKSCYHPTTRCTFINKYLKKYRCGRNYYCELTVQDLLRALEKVEQQLGGTQDKWTYGPWRRARRATVRF